MNPGACMTTTLRIPAGSLDQAREGAAKAFGEFFEDRLWHIAEESAESDCVMVNGEVLSWVCTFVAVEGAA